MGYPRDLDDYSESELVKELIRRLKLQECGLCDYCERGPDTDPCKYPTRHAHAKSEKRTYRTGRRISDRLRDRLLALQSWWTR